MRPTPIPGLLVVDLAVHADGRGWFKENWQRSKMTALGLPDFGPVQHSVAFNEAAGVTRGFHAEPWDKFVSVAHGQVVGAWLDLRDGPTYGQVHTELLDQARAVFVPRGVANAYQTQVAHTVYSYLVNGQWSADAAYTHVNLDDPAVAVDWPIPLAEALRSDKDLALPPLSAAPRLRSGGTLVIGAGQVGMALRRHLPHVTGVDRAVVDLSRPDSVDALDLTGIPDGGQRGGLHGGRRGGECGGSTPGLGRQRGRDGSAGPALRGGGSHAGALLQRLRLRRDAPAGGRLARGLADGAAVGLRPEQGGR